ncbi:MAG: hypothetical protein ACOYJG_07855 [Prevotella sp.]|jgi:hypothetical protein
MKRFFITFLCLILLNAVGWADNTFKLYPDTTNVVDVSPSGNYAVGIKTNYSVDNTYAISFLYDKSSDEVIWYGEFDMADYSKCVQFNAVNDDGIIVGQSKDTTTMLSSYDGSSRPLNCAAVWENDEITLLPYGDFDMSSFNQLSDGSEAVGISQDGNTIIGQFSASNGAYFYSCKWTRQSDNSWTLSWLDVPEGGDDAMVRFISADGNTIAGTFRSADHYTYVIVWSGDSTTYFTPGDFSDEYVAYPSFKLLDMSDNGRYLLMMENTLGTIIYDLQTKTVRMMPSLDATKLITSGAIDNNGNVFSHLSYGSPYFGGEVYTRPFWYSYENDRIIDLSYYISLYAPGLEPSIPFSYKDKSQAVVADCTGDGKTIIGNCDLYMFLGQIPKGWQLYIEPNDSPIPETPTGLTAESRALKYVTLSWDKDTTDYSTLTLASYNVYRNDTLIKNVSFSDGDVVYATDNGISGHPVYQVEAVFNSGSGGEVLSPRSADVTASLPDSYDMPLFEEFSGSLDDNYWEQQPLYGSETGIYWYIDTWYGLKAGCLNFMNSASDTTAYSTTLVTRPLDATNNDDIQVSFAPIYGFVNYDNQPLDQDTISVDVTTDWGDNWQEVKSWTIEEICPLHRWNMVKVNISDAVAGKIFKVRLRCHGLGATQWYMLVDNFKVGPAEAPAPEGLIGKKDSNPNYINLGWKNLSGAYQLNYINNKISGQLALGNAGSELIGANLFEPSDLSLYNGKYLTGVVSTINYYEYYGGDINASVVVFQDDELIREQEIENLPYNKEFVAVLDEPVQIDSTKSLKVGIKIHDYDSNQIPLLYSNTTNFVAGKSDLYSEDNGQTWKLLSEYYADLAEQGTGSAEDGYCAWNITGLVTDEPTLAVDTTEVVGYIVLRDGDTYSQLLLDGHQSHFTDSAATADAKYQVVAFLGDGSVSTPSDELSVDEITAISRVLGDNAITYRENGESEITIDGQFDSAYLVNTNGMIVSRNNGETLSLRGLSEGVYILVVEKEGKKLVRKIVIE